MLKVLSAALVAASVLIAPLAANAAQPATGAAMTHPVKTVKHKRHVVKHSKPTKAVKHTRHHKKVAKHTRHGKVVKAHKNSHVVAAKAKAKVN